MLADKDRIFTNLYGLHDWGLEGAKKRGCWLDTKTFIDKGRDWLVNEIKASGLRGRGGAGFPTGLKWSFMPKEVKDRPHYLVVNADESEPGTCKDRDIMRFDPHRLVEGALVSSFALGAHTCYIYIRGEFYHEASAIQRAIDEAYAAGFLGPRVLDSGYGLELGLHISAGRYICVEETALLNALEGKRATPRAKPPFPQVSGLFGMPTVVHNVQTVAAIPWIVLNGAEAFAATGTPDSAGTILVQLRTPAGDGIAEVPLGTPLGDIVALGGKLPAGRTVKALLVGGPSGGLLPPDLLDTPYAFEPLRAAGAHIGSGSVVVADDRACIVDLARLLTRFCAGEACGKTIPCRIGTRRLVEIADRIVDGRPRPTDPALLEDLSADIVESALCDHERLATLPLSSGMRYFRSELDEHILNSACPAGVCHPIAVAAGAIP